MSITLKISPHTLGIDLGTTNSSVSVYYGGQMMILPMYGKQSMPSVVRIPNRKLMGDDVQVGDTAKKYIITKPNEVFSSVKTLMRNDEWKDDPVLREKFTFDGEIITPTDIATHILSELRNEAQHWEHAEGDLQNVVICVPANSTPIYKKNVRDAAVAAGFGIINENGELQRDENGEVCGIYILEEPTAASLAYGVTKGFFNPKTDKEQNILVYDLGGGTFDVTILHIVTEEGKLFPKFTPVSTRGVAKLGGDDFDWTMAKIIAKKIQEETGIDILTEPSQTANKSILKFKSEELKINLSNGATEVNFFERLKVDGKELEFDYVITSEEYLEAIKPLIHRTLECVKEALDSAKMTSDDINRIVLVGGSSKAPWIKKAIIDAGYKEPYIADNVDTIVAQGASYWGTILPEIIKGGGEDENVIKPVLPHHYGIELNDGSFSPMFVKGTEYDKEISSKAVYYNPNDSGKVLVSAWFTQENLVFETDEMGRMKSDVMVSTRTDDGEPLFEWIGEFEVKVPRKPAGTVEIELELTINDQKDIHARAIVDGQPTEAFWKHE